MDPVSKNIEILLVEDNPADARLIMEAFKESKVLNKLSHANTGEEALEYLHSAASNHHRPDLIFLDLKLPGKSGFEVLSEIKSDPKFMKIPVVIISGLNSAESISRSYQLNANCYITKPTNNREFSDMIKTIEGFWFDIAKLPF